MQAAILDSIGSKLEQRRAARQAEAVAQFNDLVARFAAADEVNIDATEVEGILEASGRTLTDLRAAIDRVAQRRAAFEVYTESAGALDELRIAEQALAECDEQKRRWLAEHAERVRDAKVRVGVAQVAVRRMAEAKKVLLATAAGLAEYERYRAEAATEVQRLEAEISALRQHIDEAEKQYRAQFTKHTGHYINWPGLHEDEHPRPNESLIEAKARAASQRRTKAAQDEAARQGVTRDNLDRFIHDFVTRERERFTREFADVARVPLTKLEERLAASVAALESLKRGGEFVRKEFEEKALAP